MSAPIVTICGSMRFYDLMSTVAADETRAGRIVLMPFAVVAPDDQGSDLKAMLDRLHREKIAMSDWVIVVSDQTGYCGTSTAGEIDYAEGLGVPVDYWRLVVQHEQADVTQPTFEIELGGLRLVPCGLDCGYLAGSESDLDAHENEECENRFASLPVDVSSEPAPRAVGSIPRRVLRPGQRTGGDR